MPPAGRCAFFNGSRTRAPIIVLMIAAIFITDTVLYFEIAVAVFYIGVLLFAAPVVSRRGLIALAGLCVVLTAASLVLTRSGAWESGVVNCVISALAIGVTTVLSLQQMAAERAARDADSKLARLARVGTFGEFAASIAHEVNQPLTGIVTSAHACRRWLKADPPDTARAEASLERVIADAERAAAIIARIRAQFRALPPRMEAVDLNEVIRETADLAQSKLDHRGVTCRLSLNPDLPPVRADRVLIGQVLSNLLLNAIDAVSERPAGDRRVELGTFLSRAGLVGVAVEDNGPGISQEALAHLFEPFFTTKDGGTGMGLAISRGIVESHAGRLMYTPATTGGTIFRFTLPPMEEARP